MDTNASVPLDLRAPTVKSISMTASQTHAGMEQHVL